MKTIRKISLSVIAALALGACSKDTTVEIGTIPEGGKVKTAIEFTVPTMETPVLELAESSDGSLEIKQLPETRFSGTTADNSEKAIKNLCVLQFSADGSKRLAYDYIEVNGTGAETSITADCEIQAAADKGSHVYFVANVGNTLNSISKESEFLDAYLAVPSTKWDIASKGLPMCSALYEGPIAYGTAFSVQLNRMFAAVKFTLTNNSAFTGATIKLCNVADKAYFVSKAASTDTKQFFNYTENFTSGQTWYIPENKQGDVSPCTTADRGPSTNGGKAPACATYFDIAGTYTKNSVAYNATYRVYLGKNNTTSFAVERNNAYTITAQVAGMNVADKRIVSMSKNLSVKHGTTATAATANCYIVSRAGVTYSFDASKKGCSTTAIAGTPTKAQVLWQDYSGLIQNLNYNSGDKTITFKVTTATQGTAPEGNAVIALLDASNNVLWSWHIWSTNYNPFTTGAYQTYKTRALVASGDVLATTARDVDVMDRNLGAANNTPGDYKAGGLLYQWGRKDPFVGSKATSGTDFVTAYNSAGTSLANTWGTTITALPTPSAAAPSGIGIYKTAVTVENAVKFPMVFFATSGDWCSTKTDNLWGCPFASGVAANEYPNTAKVTKSMYDPCPEGWHVPTQDTWTAFTNNGLNQGGAGSYVNANFVVSSGNTGAWTWGYKFYYTTTMFRSGANIYYPASGLRHCETGALGYVGGEGVCWSASPYAVESVYAGSLNFYSNGYVFPLNTARRAWGYPVRCARETSER